MNKRFITVLLIIVMMMSACGKSKNDTEGTMTSAVTEVTTEAATETTALMETYPGTGISPFEDPDAVFESMAQEENSTDDSQVVEMPEATNPDNVKDSTESTKPKEEKPESADIEQYDYEKYLNMSGEEQTEFIESFASVEAFFDWLNAVKAEYEANNPGVIVDGGSIDLEEITESKK